ncbi:QueT transporter family protein [Ligilactobacillus cholophilus]|uniref:QueT transporter family protein n=1 Tax=Ligilactobacillus cholophilus TaxID=3050131 RepID=UPI0025B1B710|nr:QueT transporter family protein [Ligilactobacillus cholophilus]
MKKNEKLLGLAKGGIIAALYVAVTLVFAPISYGSIQFRISEIFNNLAVFNKRYIWALTIGCAIANCFSPLGIVDVIFGSLGTLLMTGLSYLLSRHVKSTTGKLVIAVVVCTLMTWTVALELKYVNHLPFWPTYLTVAIGEFVSMVVGAFVIGIISKRIDLTK